MDYKNYFLNYIDSISFLLKEINPDLISESVDLIKKIKNNNKIYIVGNGGSASIASHVSVDFTKVAKIKSLTFNNANFITCFANDYGYENWVDKAIEYYADKGDIGIFISSSGKSLNIINGVKKAKSMELETITLSGFDMNNPLSKLGGNNLWVDSKSYNYIEMTHHIWLLAIVDYIIKFPNIGNI